MKSVEPTNRTSKSELKYFISYLIIYTIGIHLQIIIPVVVVVVVLILCIVIPIICYVKRRMKNKHTKGVEESSDNRKYVNDTSSNL